MSLSKQVDYKMTVLPTGLHSLDKMLGGGLRRGSLTLIASRPGMGKTSLALQIAGNLALEGKHVMFFSYELLKEHILLRLKKPFGNVSVWDTLNIDDCFHPQGADFIRTDVIRNHKECDAVFIDYLQLLPRRPDRSAMIECIRALKAFARSANIPVIVTSQLPRPDVLPPFNEKETYHRPILSDLYDLKIPALYADVVIFPFRESYYMEDLEEEIDELIVAGNNYGVTGTIPVHWNPEKLIFEETDQ